MKKILTYFIIIALSVITIEASYDFTNDTDKIEVGSTAIPDDSIVSLWLKPVEGYNNVKNYSFFNAQQDGNNYFDFESYSGTFYAGWVTSGVDYRVVTSSGIPTSGGTWMNLAQTTNNTTHITRLFKNGSQIGSNATGVSIFYTGGTTRVIGRDIINGSFHVGKIGQVFVGNIIPSDATILALGTGISCPNDYAVGRVNYWPLILNANDSWGSDNGTVTGASLDGDTPSITCAAVTTTHTFGLFHLGH